MLHTPHQDSDRDAKRQHRAAKEAEFEPDAGGHRSLRKLRDRYCSFSLTSTLIVATRAWGSTIPGEKLTEIIHNTKYTLTH